MTWTLRVTNDLLDAARRDLRRSHSHAAERVGFVLCRVGNELGTEKLLLPFEYMPVRDEYYIPDPFVGARIDGNAIRFAMERVLRDRAAVLHVHLHEHRGRPTFSKVDIDNYPLFVRAFRNVGADMPHGALLLSHDCADALVWLPGRSGPVPGGRIVVTGRPLGFSAGSSVYA